MAQTAKKQTRTATPVQRRRGGKADRSILAAKADASAKSDPKQQIIAAAETILARHGVNAATVRAITGAADVNMAAINYHFGSRDQLFIFICSRRMQPSNEAVLAALDALEARTMPPTPAEIFRPLVSAALTIWVKDDVLRALRSLLIHSPQTVEALKLSSMSTVYSRMRGALRQACPHLTPQQVRKRFQMAMATIMYTLMVQDADLVWSREDIAVDDLVDFVAAAFAQKDDVED